MALSCHLQRNTPSAEPAYSRLWVWCLVDRTMEADCKATCIVLKLQNTLVLKLNLPKAKDTPNSNTRKNFIFDSRIFFVYFAGVKLWEPL